MATHKESIDIWLKFYKEKTGQNYILDGKQCSHLKQLIKKVHVKTVDHSIDPSDENVLNSFKALLYSIKNRWIIDNLDISIVNSKFNVIYNEAINKSFINRAEQIDDIIRNSARAK
jgi:hypothetical protein